MARIKKEVTETVETSKLSSDKFNTFIKGLRKQIDSSSFESSKYGEVSEYIDTGDYGLNRIISGSINKGIPAGRIVSIVGESQTGKSLLAAQIASNALNKLGYSNIFYFDSEGGALKKFFTSRGCDPKKIEHVLVENVEDASVKILNTFEAVRLFKAENPEYKTLFILDSLGALVTTKYINDALVKGKVAGEMGLRAKDINTMMKACTIPALKTGVSFIVINHTYSDPSSLYASKIQNQGGGEGIKYMSRITLQCTKALEKSEKDNSYYEAAVMTFFSVKNNLIKPYYNSQMLLSFSKGPSKYFGLVDVALQYGLLRNPVKGRYNFIHSPEDTKLTLKQLLNCEEDWQKILPELDSLSMKELSYGEGREFDVDELNDSEDEDDSSQITENIDAINK